MLLERKRRGGERTSAMVSKRRPTNTLIVTNVDEGLLLTPHPFVEFLTQNKILMEFVLLMRFRRFLVICRDPGTASHVYDLIRGSEDWKNLEITYSMRDNPFTNLDDDDFSNYTTEKDYLELPAEVMTKRFLISPPRSPPSEWDHWDRVEEHPHKDPIYSHQDLSHLLWERLGGEDSNSYSKVHDTDGADAESTYTKEKLSEVLFKDIDNGVPAIVLDSLDGKILPSNGNATLGKTALPPTFD